MLRRLFHNAFQTLKKDNGAHFTYNLGVGFVRAGVAFLLLPVLLLAAFFINPGDLLSYKGNAQATIIGMDERVIDPSHGISTRSRRELRVWTVTFMCEYNTSSFVVEQTVPHSVYSEYISLYGSRSKIPVKLYSSRVSGLYVSRNSRFGAGWEYNRTHSDLLLVTLAEWACGAALPLIGIGLGEERLAMKYPRKDVLLEDHSIVVADDDTEELLKEFDRAYEKFKADKAAGLPTSEPPRTDGKHYGTYGEDSGEEPLRLEKK